MQTSPERHVKKSRKSYMCDWCWEVIEKGSSYTTWFTYGENVTARLHRECYEAMCLADLYDNELPPAGTYRRGCHCGERKEQCECVVSKENL